MADLHAPWQQTNEQTPTTSKLIVEFTYNNFLCHLLSEQRYSSYTYHQWKWIIISVRSLNVFARKIVVTVFNLEFVCHTSIIVCLNFLSDCDRCLLKRKCFKVCLEAFWITLIFRCEDVNSVHAMWWLHLTIHVTSPSFDCINTIWSWDNPATIFPSFPLLWISAMRWSLHKQQLLSVGPALCTPQ